MASTKLEFEIDRLIQESINDFQNGNVESSWQKLAEAHILSQPYAVLHTAVHLNMLLLAIKHKSFYEMTGQLIRLLIAAPGSLLHIYPVGNSGRSDINMFLPQEIPTEIKNKIDQLNK